MNQKEEKIRVNARVPKNLYDWVCSIYDNTSQAINEGLEILRESKIRECHPEANNACHDNLHEHTYSGEEILWEQKVRIEDLKAQVQALYEQLHTKDEQIEKLNESMHKQAVHIQTLIQENSRLNVKLLPEVTESKKPWWKLW